MKVEVVFCFKIIKEVVKDIVSSKQAFKGLVNRNIRKLHY